MTPYEPLREILPLAVALSLAVGAVQMQATQPARRDPSRGFTAEEMLSGLRRHLVEMARYEQHESLDQVQ